jgi:hypothetical protein
MCSEDINVGALVCFYDGEVFRYWQVEHIDDHGGCILVNHELGKRIPARIDELEKWGDKPQVWCAEHGPSCKHGCIR